MNRCKTLSEIKIFESNHNRDLRGNFREWYKDSLMKTENTIFNPVQGNFSTSKKGVIRGIHYSLVAEGQSKLISCLNGSIQDVVVDLRRNSPTFLMKEYIYLNEDTPLSLYIPKGFGHAFQALEDNTIVAYLIDSEYDSKNEYGINPFDLDLKIEWRLSKEIISQKDREEKSVQEAISKNLLPFLDIPNENL